MQNENIIEIYEKFGIFLFNVYLGFTCASGNERLTNELLELEHLIYKERINLYLCGACIGGNEKIIEKLIQLGGDNLSKSDFSNALTHIFNAGHLNLVKRFIEHGAEVDKKHEEIYNTWTKKQLMKSNILSKIFYNDLVLEINEYL